MNNFVESLNIIRLNAMLAEKNGPARRATLEALLNEAQQRQRDNPDADTRPPKAEKH